MIEDALNLLINAKKPYYKYGVEFIEGGELLKDILIKFKNEMLN